MHGRAPLPPRHTMARSYMTARMSPASSRLSMAYWGNTVVMEPVRDVKHHALGMTHNTSPGFTAPAANTALCRGGGGGGGCGCGCCGRDCDCGAAVVFVFVFVFVVGDAASMMGGGAPPATTLRSSREGWKTIPRSSHQRLKYVRGSSSSSSSFLVVVVALASSLFFLSAARFFFFGGAIIFIFIYEKLLTTDLMGRAE